MSKESMVNKSKAKTQKEVEPESDAWARFEKAIHKIAPPRKPKSKKTAAKK